MSLGQNASQVVRTMAMLSIAEHLDEVGSSTAAELASRVSSDPDMTYRLLRAGAALGFLRYDPTTSAFSGTSMLRVLHKDAPNSLKYAVQNGAGPAIWQSALRFPETVRTGRSQVVEALGSELFDYFGQHAEEAEIFSAAMTELSAPVIRSAIPLIDVGSAEFAVDVGAHSAAARGAGLSDDAIEDLVAARTPEGLDRTAQLAHDVALALVRDHDVSDGLYAEFLSDFGETRAVALLALIGQYLATCAVVTCFRVPAPGACPAQFSTRLTIRSNAMPLADIYLHQGVTTRDQRKAISDAIHAAMVDTLHIPDDDRFHYFHEFPEGTAFHEDVVFGLPRSNRLMCITLSFNNRTADTKKALFESLVDQLREKAGVPPEDVAFRIVETARENWWAAGRVIDARTGYDERMTTIVE
ncbi:tautomerase family protein [Nocardia arthritidis]|nr:tautomerase family protein [Nocardia arthritidis]